MSTIAEHLALIEALRLTNRNDAAHQESWLFTNVHWQDLVAMTPADEMRAARVQTEQRLRDQHPAHAEELIDDWRAKRPAEPAKHVRLTCAETSDFAQDNNPCYVCGRKLVAPPPVSEDTKRLDWLESSGTGTVEIFRFKLFDYEASKYEQGFVINKGKAETSLRAAIDAARPPAGGATGGAETLGREKP